MPLFEVETQQNLQRHGLSRGISVTAERLVASITLQ